MKKTAAVFFTMIISSIALAQKTPTSSSDNQPNMAIESKHPNFVKNWYVGVGPLISNTFPGTNGTKFAITLGYEQGLNEHFSLLYFSDNNFNSASAGSTLIQSINAGVQYFLRDRGADNSIFFQADLGYGGSNKFNDANILGGVGAGFQFYRLGDFTFQALIREALLYNNVGSLIGGVSWTQLMVGIYF